MKLRPLNAWQRHRIEQHAAEQRQRRLAPWLAAAAVAASAGAVLAFWFWAWPWMKEVMQ